MNLRVIPLGLVPYKEALLIQDKLVEQRINDEIPDTLLLLEHPPVITTGRREQEHNILINPEAMGVELYKTSRGGEVTYHGPGQLVGYPIQKLDTKKHRFLVNHVANLEEVFIRHLAKNHGITAGRIDKHTGVWIGNSKITAIGISLHRRVTKHGFAYNINPNLEHFSWIVPCGITDKGVTSLSKELSRTVEVSDEIPHVASVFQEVFGYDTVTFQGKDDL